MFCVPLGVFNLLFTQLIQTWKEVYFISCFAYFTHLLIFV
ncbi:unnamed protein product [Tenebrio molitor]|nr:unnamed protein product [Tenebrio molitor]